ncbi:MAG: sugar phosphate nucleotidyltransferase [Verrucomicrobiota bacterium]|nr:sugar phosphate nucleotidyltransferase [Verrucomicrobiota bacterium]
MITQAFVLGAGLGTRLRPLTEQLPKPLVPIFQKPLITFALDHLIELGVKDFVVNTHRLPGEFQEIFSHGEYRARSMRLIHEPVLLETGGGIKNAEGALRAEPFIVYSGDILTDVDLRPLLEEHVREGNDVTLALRDTGLATGVALENRRVIDIGGKLGHRGQHDFANISIWNPEIFGRIPAGEKVSFVPILRDWIQAKGRIGGIVLNDARWFNIGSRAEYLAVHRQIIAENWKPNYVNQAEWPVRCALDASVAKGARLIGCCSIGSGASVGEDAELEDTIVWPGAQIASRSRLRNCIVRSHSTAAGELSDLDI